jgi:hypothetical protein
MSESVGEVDGRVTAIEVLNIASDRSRLPTYLCDRE